MFAHYSVGLIKGIFTNSKGHRFACFDMLMTLAPGMLLSVVSIIFNAVIIALSCTGIISAGVAVASSISSIFFCLFNYFMFMFVFGILTTFVEWNSIRASLPRKLWSMVTFPLFMMTYIPIALVAIGFQEVFLTNATSAIGI